MSARIADMLTYRRAHDSAGEAEFIARYIAPTGADTVTAPDGTVHAYVLDVASDAGDGPVTAWCAHTDSVHNRQLPAPRQAVAYDPIRREYFVADEGQRDCLGADDAAGCYVLLRMIAAGVPGRYMFFRGEERGGIGSSWTARNRPGLLTGIRHAVQFDRRGTESIITHMSCGRTCSTEFARSLAGALGMGHVPDDTGSFTDTAELAELVPECTNVSVGYDHEHSAAETLDGAYLERLAVACIEAFSGGTGMLPVEREAGDYDACAWAGDDWDSWAPADDDAAELLYVLRDATRALGRLLPVDADPRDISAYLDACDYLAARLDF